MRPDQDRDNDDQFEDKGCGFQITSCLAVLLIGIMIGYYINSKEPPAVVDAAQPINFATDLVIRVDNGEPVIYRPHSVLIENKRSYVSPLPPPRGETVTISQDMGRLKIAATRVYDR